MQKQWIRNTSSNETFVMYSNVYFPYDVLNYSKNIMNFHLITWIIIFNFSVSSSQKRVTDSSLNPHYIAIDGFQLSIMCYFDFDII